MDWSFRWTLLIPNLASIKFGHELRATSVTMLSSNKVLYIFVVILFGILYVGAEVEETNQKPRYVS